MFYLDSDRLLLTHYCDAGNRPRMAARVSPDGKKVEFDFLDLSGGTQARTTWTMRCSPLLTLTITLKIGRFMMTGDKPMHAHMDLQRVNKQTASAR